MENKNKHRPVDRLARSSYSWTKKHGVLTTKTHISSWKALLLITFLAGGLAAVIMVVNYDIQTFSLANNIVNSKKKGVGHEEIPAILAPTLFEESDEQIPDKVKKAAKVKPGRSRAVQLDANLLESDALELNLFDDTSLVVRRDRTEQYGKDGQVWVGHVQGERGTQVTLAKKGSTISGIVMRGEQVYEITHVKSNTYAVQELDPRVDAPADPILVPDGVPTAGETTSNSTTSSATTAGDTSNVIDLMVVYTPAAKANAGGASGVEAKILTAVANANQAYINSQVDMRLNVVYMGEVSYTETGNMSTSLSDITGTSDGKMDNVHTLRNQYAADQVALITTESNYCGIGYMMTSGWLGSAFAAYAFSVVHDDSRYSCLRSHTLAHELGHNQGNDHDHNNTGGGGAYGYSYGYQNCGAFRTVMAYNCSGEPRIANFSNPNISYNGQATGVANWADAARSMNGTAPIVTAWRTGAASTTPAAPGNLVASAISASQINLSWSDNANSESGFRIQRSLDGNNWSEIASLGSNVTGYSNTGLMANTIYYYRVLAYNSVGSSAYSNVSFAKTQALVADTEIPVVTLSNPVDGSMVSRSKINIMGYASDNVGVVSYSCIVNGKVIKTSSMSGSGSLSCTWDARRATLGTHTIAIQAKDAAGNQGSAAATVTIIGDSGGGSGGPKGKK
jgi:hypothetical protein